jgi:hypothetical protein
MRQDRSIPTNQIRVGDLKERHVITAQCWKCKHVATIPPARIRRGRPAAMLLIDVSFRMHAMRRARRADALALSPAESRVIHRGMRPPEVAVYSADDLP